MLTWLRGKNNVILSLNTSCNSSIWNKPHGLRKSGKLKNVKKIQSFNGCFRVQNKNTMKKRNRYSTDHPQKPQMTWRRAMQATLYTKKQFSSSLKRATPKRNLTQMTKVILTSQLINRNNLTFPIFVKRKLTMDIHFPKTNHCPMTWPTQQCSTLSVSALLINWRPPLLTGGPKLIGPKKTCLFWESSHLQHDQEQIKSLHFLLIKAIQDYWWARAR